MNKLMKKKSFELKHEINLIQTYLFDEKLNLCNVEANPKK